MNTKDLRVNMGHLTQYEFSERFHIPFRTVQNWDYRDCMPDYIHELVLEVHQLRVYNKILKQQID